MALLKEVETKYGVSLSYWKIIGIHVENQKHRCRITIVPYLNGDARDSGLLPFDTEGKEITVEDISYTDIDEYKKYEVTDFTDYFSSGVISGSGKNIYELAYLYIKEKVSMFENSVDI